jgi:hypothetical protein
MFAVVFDKTNLPILLQFIVHYIAKILWNDLWLKVTMLLQTAEVTSPRFVAKFNI